MPNKHGEKDWLDTALPLINSLEITELDADGEVLYYAFVDNTEENREVLIKAGVTPTEIEEATTEDNKNIDLTFFVWNFALWFDGRKFLRENSGKKI